MWYPVTLLPAYGAKYNSKESMLNAWNAGKDFSEAQSRAYCSIRDLRALSYLTSSIRIIDPSSGISIQITPMDL